MSGKPRPRRSPAARVRRLVRKLLGRPSAKAKRRAQRPGENEVFEHLWRTATTASPHGKRFSIYQPNALLFQMGKVASSAIEVALIERGINCFHCHSLRHEDEAGRLSNLFKGEPGIRSAAIDLKLLSKHTALNMLVRWYRSNPVAPERKLKVITLTRDPLTWLSSQMLQRFGYEPRLLIDWHRAFANAGAPDGDLGEATGALLRQVAQLVIETRPSEDVAAARDRGQALAMAMQPQQPFIAEQFARCLVPLGWFDTQFTPVFGIDIRSLPEFAERGLAQRDLGFAEVLFVRFEDLAEHTQAIGRFVGLAGFGIAPRNVSIEKTYGAQITHAARAFQATELGIAARRELRQSDYGRACGYDRSVGV